ncbi:MAG TPA: DUF1080 domain-containing protein [Candidatus Saccharimonadales bacterium]|nr:DUF1080 domain-containing protein [Candidatus Saccharimonadales bacterium]
MKGILLTAAGSLLLALQLHGADPEAGFKTIFDGTSLAGWKTATEHPGTWKIEDGALVAHGERCHIYYVGEEKPFKDFELKVDVMTEPGSNGGIYFHTRYQEEGWPKYGFESQVNVSHTDWIKTGSLYGVVNVGLTTAQDNKWWTQHIIVQGNRVTVKVDGKTVLEYNEPPGARAGADYTRKIEGGTFALQAHDPKSIIRYKNIRVKRLD